MIQKVSILGTGLVGKALAMAFKNSGLEVTVYNRSAEKALQLAKQIRVSVTEELDTLLENPLIVIAVTDDAISEVFRTIKPRLDEQIVVHTSGTRSIECPEGIANFGLFYPLDSFGYHRDWDMKDTPIFIEASSADVLDEIKSVAFEVSSHVYQLDRTKRPWLHLAAVIMNNFTNAMVAEAHDILKAHDIPGHALDKLLQTTMLKATTSSPHASQTGPARRGDISTIRKHLEMLDDNELITIYKLISQRINKDLKI